MKFKFPLRSFTNDKHGDIAIIFAISLIPLLIAVGGTIDYSIASSVKTHLQGVVDSAVLAGAKQNNLSDRMTTANNFAAAQYATAAATNTIWAFGTDDDGRFSGTISTDVPTSFLGLMGMNTIRIKATATAAESASSSKVCILLVDPNRSPSLLMNSGVNLTAPNCEIHVLSSGSPAAIFNAGNTLNVMRICVKGSYVIQNGGAVASLATNCTPAADPFVNSLPSMSNPGCNYNNKTFDSGNVSLVAGVYCGYTNFNGSGSITMSPGLYVIRDGAMTFNSGRSVTGTGVTFYLANSAGSLTFNGNVTANLKAPASGTYANLLMFEPGGLSQTQLIINGTSGSSFQGLMYLPSRDVTVNSVSNVSSDGVTMVFNSLILNNINWKIESSVLAITGGATTGDGNIYLIR